MKKRLSTLLLVLGLLSTLLAGCGSPATSTESTATSAPVQETTEVSETSEAAAPAAPDVPDGSAQESASIEEAEAVFAPYEWPLPLTDEDVTFSISMMINPQLASYFSGYEENPAWQEYSKLTGVNFEFSNISAMNIGEHIT